jgi:hypothetical protein
MHFGCSLGLCTVVQKYTSHEMERSSKMQAERVVKEIIYAEEVPKRRNHHWVGFAGQFER